MATYELKDVLYIREMRRDMAQENLIRCQYELKEAIETLEKKEKELEEYKEWAKKEEDRLFDEIKNKKVRKDEIDILKSKLAKLKEDELKKAKAVTDAKTAVKEAEDKVVEAKGLLLQMQLNLEKILEHKDVWLEEANLEEQRVSDLEMEEHGSRQLTT